MSKLICVDAGHGGTDSGAVNGGKYEKAVTLATAKILKRELEANGFQVILTRDTDKTLALQERCNISNKANADFFISIHCNSSTNKDAQGIETWRYPTTSKKEFADNVQNRLIEAVEAKNRGVREGSFYVIKNTRCPAILVEMGFISHAEESIKLFKTYHQTDIAKAIAKGLVDTVNKQA